MKLINPTQLYSLLKTELGNQQWELSQETYQPSGTEVKDNYFLTNNKGVIITTPSHDYQQKYGIRTTAEPLENTLNVLKNTKTSWKKAIIPICQSNKYFFGLITRRHFTYMEINKDEQGKIIAHHYDSKGLLSKYYPLNTLKSSIEEIFGAKNVQFNPSYLGHQKISDNINCGRFVLSYIQERIRNNFSRKQSNPLNESNKFQYFDNELNNINKESMKAYYKNSTTDNTLYPKNDSENMKWRDKVTQGKPASLNTYSKTHK